MRQIFLSLIATLLASTVAVAAWGASSAAPPVAVSTRAASGGLTAGGRPDMRRQSLDDQGSRPPSPRPGGTGRHDPAPARHRLVHQVFRRRYPGQLTGRMRRVVAPVTGRGGAPRGSFGSEG